MYTHKEFLEGINSGKLKFRVNQDVYRSEVEPTLADGYKMAVAGANGASILLLVMALPIYLLTGWILAVLSIAGSLWVYFYFRRLNYRVFVRAQAKENEEFFEFAQKRAVILIMKVPEKIDD